MIYWRGPGKNECLLKEFGSRWWNRSTCGIGALLPTSTSRIYLQVKQLYKAPAEHKQRTSDTYKDTKNFPHNWVGQNTEKGEKETRKMGWDLQP